MKQQKTLCKSIKFTGIGLHTGNNVTICFNPAPPNSGVVFVRTDLPEPVSIRADFDNVSGVIRGTTIAKGDVKIHTVEHVLAAAAGAGIDNLVVELDNNEPPAFDGSARPILELFQKAGIELQGVPKKEIKITKPICVSDFNQAESYARHIIVLPSDELKISYTIEYDEKAIGTQFAEFVISESVFAEEISSARTFGFLHEKESLQKLGLALGASTDNAIVIHDNKILNGQLRFEDEFVRHKILDVLGDIFLLGIHFKAHIIAIKGGHLLNVELLKKIRSEYQEEILKEEKNAERIAKQLKNNKNNTGGTVVFDINDIQSILPHRYPMLLVDRILELEDSKYAVGLKNVSMNEAFFQGHFPQRAVMPGVLICEALAQVAGVLMMKDEKFRNKLPFFAGMDKVKFRKPVVPGDQLILRVEVLKLRGTVGKVKGIAKVDDKVVAEGELMFSLVDK